MCGHHPYLEIQSDYPVIGAIMEGVRPEKPEGAKQLGFSDELWGAVELCWLEDRHARPSVEDILSCLNVTKYSVFRSSAFRSFHYLHLFVHRSFLFIVRAISLFSPFKSILVYNVEDQPPP